MTLRAALWGDIGFLCTVLRCVGNKNIISETGKAYAADVTKYSEKQRVIVQKAIDSGVLNNTNRSHEFVDVIAKVYEDKGVSFDFTNNKRLRASGFALDGVTVNGYVTKDGITINMDSPKVWQSTVGHEITHVLEGTELYTTLQEAIFKYANRAGTFDAMRKKIADTYKNIEGADISKELTAELVGEYLFTDEKFVKQLSVEHRNVFQKIYDEIKYLAKLVTAGSKEARALEEVKHTFEKVYREGTAQKNTVGDGEVRYSISPTLDSDLDAVLSGTFNADKSEVYLGETSNFMTDVIGVQSMFKTMPPSKMYSAMVTRGEQAKTGYYKEEAHYHGLGKDKVLEILNASENPIAAFADTPDAKGNDRLDRIVLVTNVKAIDAETGNEGYAVVIEKVDAPALLNGNNITADKDITIYPMDQVGDQINLAIADGRILDIKKQGQSLAGLHGAISQTAIQDTVLKNNIANFWANVKWKNEKNKTFSSKSETWTDTTTMAAALQKVGLLDQDGHTQSMHDGENDASDVEALSLSTINEDLAPVGDFATPANELRYEGERGVEDVAPYGDDVDVSDDLAPVREDLTQGDGTSRAPSPTVESANDATGKSTKKDKLARAYARIDRHLEADKVALKEEFDKRAHELEAQVADKDGFISARAKELYNELRDLKKGVRASGELGYLLDTLGGKDWSSLKTALINAMNSPSAAVNKGPAIESAVREMLAEEYADVERSLENVEVDYESELAELEKGAERAREVARREATHSVLTWQIKNRYVRSGF